VPSGSEHEALWKRGSSGRKRVGRGLSELALQIRPNFLDSYPGQIQQDLVPSRMASLLFTAVFVSGLGAAPRRCGCAKKKKPNDRLDRKGFPVAGEAAG
jgi:hypothetical protein